MPKIVFQEERCKGCGLCVLACPKKSLIISQRLNEQGYTVAEIEKEELCTGCALCAELCPDVVIEVWK
jgi:2-oxoglutarate ferredoxin oxidoreductase subunit delta